MLKFKDANGKLKKMAKKLGVKLKTFTLPAGYTCPGAKDCLAYADRKTGKVKDGKDTEFRCFMASLEATFPSLRAMVWENLEQLKLALQVGWMECADLIDNSLPNKFDVMRVHVGGDYFSEEYFLAWREVAKRNPDKIFYSYTKSLHILEKYELPENFVFTASRGGKYDDFIDLNLWKEAVVVFNEQEAKELDLEIDHDDTHAAFGKENFALLIHGTQPAGSAAGEALKVIKKKARA